MRFGILSQMDELVRGPSRIPGVGLLHSKLGAIRYGTTDRAYVTELAFRHMICLHTNIIEDYSIAAAQKQGL